MNATTIPDPKSILIAKKRSARALPDCTRDCTHRPASRHCRWLGSPSVAWPAGSDGAGCRIELGPLGRPYGLGAPALAGFEFHFSISRDGEYVKLELSADDVVFDLGGRTHHRMLAVLAQHRLRHRSTGLPETSCGWVYADELVRDAGIDRALVNLHVFRARKELASKGIADSALVVERRATTHEVRIGTGRLSIATL